MPATNTTQIAETSAPKRRTNARPAETYRAARRNEARARQRRDHARRTLSDHTAPAPLLDQPPRPRLSTRYQTGRSVLLTRVVDGLESSYHATKGWRFKRVALSRLVTAG